MLEAPVWNQSRLRRCATCGMSVIITDPRKRYDFKKYGRACCSHSCASKLAKPKPMSKQNREMHRSRMLTNNPMGDPVTTSQDADNYASYLIRPYDSGRERADHSPTKADGNGLRLGDGSHSRHGSAFSRKSKELQVRCGQPGFNGGYRSRRSKSRIIGKTETGPNEREGTYWVRLDRVEIYESTDRQRFRELCPDGFVYNLEVENCVPHTFVANGFCSSLTVPQKH